MLKNKSIIICSIVRDAEKSLRRNLPVLKKLFPYFKNYRVIVFENDSKDKTKEVLKKWMIDDVNHIQIFMDDFYSEKATPSAKSVCCNPFFSNKRISKMVSLRNQYLDYIEQKGLEADYLMVLDLDVASINLDGIISSFDNDVNWDAVTAFGYSLSPKLRKRYHDSYALTECGDEDKPQTELKIIQLADKYGRLKPEDDWVRVFSAFGGLAIYKFEAIKGLRYKLINNDDNRVEVRCEHFSLYKQMVERGYNKFYINPAMVLKYQDLTWGVVFNSLKRNFLI